ncbi:MAG: acetylornithine deacetylase/succinyl-diaminopimelate desuccinylase-like protein [Acidimicrobiales bacterium]
MKESSVNQSSMNTSSMDRARASELIAEVWCNEIVPELERYIAIPALSPAFDPGWADAGHIQAAVDQIVGWILSRPIAGLSVVVQELPGLTPLIVVEVDAFGLTASPDRAPDGPDASTVVLYGHLDKQPEMTGWRDGLGPWTPVRDGDRLYGRGGADDGYAAFASLTAIEAVQVSGGSHSRCILLIEASEESGSPDLPAHIDALAERLGEVGLVLCLDSGCATYDTLWLTTSLRGLVGATVTVDVITEGIHSGSASGLVPSSFRLMRQLLDRIEEATTGQVLLTAANVEIPDYRASEAAATAAVLGSGERYPTVAGLELMVDDPTDALLARTWKPALSVTGADGLPPTGKAGNVLRPSTSLKLSIRLPPTADSETALAELQSVLSADPPSGATITITDPEAATGWNAPDLDPWLADALEQASQDGFGQPMQLLGEGGTIPFMGMLGQKFPNAQFVITGVLGPESNAHGPNEFLDVAYAEKLTTCLAGVLSQECTRV